MIMWSVAIITATHLLGEDLRTLGEPQTSSKFENSPTQGPKRVNHRQRMKSLDNDVSGRGTQLVCGLDAAGCGILQKP